MKKTVLLLMSALIFLLNSCSSLPLPGTHSESLLIIPVKIDSDLGSESGKKRSVSMAYLELINMDTGKKRKLSIVPRSDDYFSATVEPGRYQLGNELTLNISQTPGNDSWRNKEALTSGPMLIEKSIVYISPLVLKAESNEEGGYNYDFYNSNSNDDPVRKESYHALISERRFKAWELYQLVGWESTE